MIKLHQLYDIQELMEWRAEVIRNVFAIEPDKSLLDENRRYYLRHLTDESHIAFVASLNDIKCGCGAICISDELPSPDNPSGKCAYLMNIYVREAFRKHGIGHRIVSRLIEEAKNRNCGKIYLETTADGKPVYSSLGFRDMADMMKYYDTKNNH